MRHIALSLSLAIVVLVGFGAKSHAAATGQNFLGSYGFGVQGNQFGPQIFVDLGVFTVRPDGSLTGTDLFEGAFPPFPSNAENSSFPLTGTWSLDSDGVSGTLDTNFGVFRFEMFDKGDVLYLSRTDSFFENGRAIRQNPAFITAAQKGTGKPTFANVSLCTAVNQAFPFPDFPSGIPVSIIGVNFTSKSGYTETDTISGNGFSFSQTTTTPASVTVHPDGTFTGTNSSGHGLFGVLTSSGQDDFITNLQSDFVGLCLVHIPTPSRRP